MEYTEFSAYPITGGALTTWAPTALQGAWRPDDRELSFDHEAHLADEGDGSWIGAVMRVPMPYDEGAVRRTLRAWTARHEVLRTTVRAAEDGGWHRETCRPEDVDVTVLDRAALDRDGVLDRLLDTFARVRPTAWPHVLFATVRPDGATDSEGFHLAFGADHSVMDAYSQLLWFDEMVVLYRRALAGDTDRELAQVDVGSHVDFAAFDRRLGQLVTEHDAAVEVWSRFLDRATADRTATDPSPGPAFPRYPDPVLAARADTAAAHQQSFSVPVLDAADTAQLNGWARSLGTGLQSVALAGLARAVQRQTGADELDLVLPMHTRHEPRYAGAVGWYVGLSPLHLDLADDASLTDLVRRTHHAVNAVKHLATRPFARIGQLLEVEDVPRFVVSYVDVRHVPGAGSWHSWQARTLRSAAPDADEVYFWIIRDEDGINVSARCPAGERAAARMEQLMADYQQVLAQAAGRARGTTGLERGDDARVPA
ncbi:condensation domain-containing protein [Nocardioides sambongensis]|uniref:condensation domain-containing protein n=1 Tax=Nocardioides sambongensis TaxID=2589074 RepID=UPI0015E86220|nr:condensation domain-containing protein [Nocardioides sambongensis]